MAQRKRTKNAKALIIETATEVFAEFGYDGARVDEIAKRADIAKALIYYHFKGKADILKALIDNFLEEFEDTVKSTMGDDQAIEQAFQSFVEEREAVIRIILIESLKSNENVPPMFRLIETLIQVEKDLTNRDNEGDLHKRYLAEFFINMVPRALYGCFKADWSKHFSVDKEELDKEFYSMMVDVHGAYLRKLF